MSESRHSSMLRIKLAERRAEILGSIARGVETWDVYKQMIGHLQGLEEAAHLSDETDFELSQ